MSQVSQRAIDEFVERIMEFARERDEATAAATLKTAAQNATAIAASTVATAAVWPIETEAARTLEANTQIVLQEISVGDTYTLTVNGLMRVLDFVSVGDGSTIVIGADGRLYV